MAGRRQRKARRLGVAVVPVKRRQGIDRRREALEERLAKASTPSDLIAAAADFLRGVTKMVTPAEANMIAAEIVQTARRHGRRVAANTRTGGGAAA